MRFISSRLSKWVTFPTTPMHCSVHVENIIHSCPNFLEWHIKLQRSTIMCRLLVLVSFNDLLQTLDLKCARLTCFLKLREFCCMRSNKYKYFEVKIVLSPKTIWPKGKCLHGEHSHDQYVLIFKVVVLAPSTLLLRLFFCVCVINFSERWRWLQNVSCNKL
jgi:hypothetical protein